jgi:predicted acyltransferase
MAGAWMRERRPGGAAAGLLAVGGAAIATGLAWDVVFPINKSLWTSSYALFTAGTACVVLGLLHRVLDGSRRAPWLDRASEPLVALGRNALLLFVVSGLVAKTLLVWQVGAAGSAQQWIFSRVFAPWAAPRVASLAYAVTNLAVLYGLLAWLHGRRWYWSV